MLNITDLEALGMMATKYGRYIEAQYGLKKKASIVMTEGYPGQLYQQGCPCDHRRVAALQTNIRGLPNYGDSGQERPQFQSPAQHDTPSQIMDQDDILMGDKKVHGPVYKLVQLPPVQVVEECHDVQRTHRASA